MTMQTMMPVVRKIRLTEIDAVRAVMAAANAEFEGRVPAGFFQSYLASQLDIEGRIAEGASVLVAAADERILGSITYYRDANDEAMGPGFPAGTAGLRATGVHPDARGYGVGSALVSACIA
ncbi:MAG: GNAT family N-acetyltransferase, partial [Chloroflexota bacterium]